MANDAALEQALAALLEERAAIDQAIAGLQKRLGKGAAVTGAGSLAATMSGSGTLTAKLSPAMGDIVTHPGEFHQHSLPEAVLKILQRAGRPVKTAEIVAALQRAQFESKSKALQQHVYTGLARHKLFLKVRPNTWGLSEWFPNSQPAESEPKKRRRRGRRTVPKLVGKAAKKDEIDHEEQQLKTG